MTMKKKHCSHNNLLLKLNVNQSVNETVLVNINFLIGKTTLLPVHQFYSDLKAKSI